MMNPKEHPQRIMAKSTAFWNSVRVVNWRTHIISCLPAWKQRQLSIKLFCSTFRLTKGFCPVTSHFCSGIEAIVSLLRGKTYIGHYNNGMLLRHMDWELKGTTHCKNNTQHYPVILGACTLLINIVGHGCIRIGGRGLFCIKSLQIFQRLDG